MTEHCSAPTTVIFTHVSVHTSKAPCRCVCCTCALQANLARKALCSIPNTGAGAGPSCTAMVDLLAPELVFWLVSSIPSVLETTLYCCIIQESKLLLSTLLCVQRVTSSTYTLPLTSSTYTLPLSMATAWHQREMP